MIKPIGKFDKIGTWIGSNGIANISKSIEKCKKYGINHLDFIINDATRSDNYFHIFYNKSKILDAIELAQKNNIETSITSWAIPRSDWIKGIKDVITPLAKESESKELTFDIEGPWISFLKNKDESTINKWSDELKEASSEFEGWRGITSIVYSNFKIIEPILNWVDMCIPQAYAILSNAGHLKPGQLEKIAYKFYEKYNKRIIIGAACYDLEGSYGLSETDALISSLNSTIQLELKETRFWSLAHLEEKLGNIIKEFI